MKVGVDTFTLRDLKLDPFQQLDYIQKLGLEGAQFGGVWGLSPTRDPGVLKAIQARAKELGLYTEVSVSVTLNPCTVGMPEEEHLRVLTEEIEMASACGWHELHGSLGGGDERYLHPVPWTRHLADSAVFLRKLSPVLRQHGCRIDLETHGDITTFELVRLIEEVGPDCVGICLDTANVMCHCEDPTAAIKRAAPYTHLTHTKDAVAYFSERGIVRQTLPPGRGAIDWAVVLPILAEYSPNLPMSIEDHKWLFYFHCFEPHWLALHPDLTRDELARFMHMIWRCHQRRQAGELPDPEEYEKIPHVEEVTERLKFGCDYLKALIRQLGLEDRPASSAGIRSLSLMKA
jgi:sugar phosphate isomerase/epimerase